MKLQPLNARVLVKPDASGEKKIGGLYIPDTGSERSGSGVVVEISASGVENIAVGDRVMYKKESGEEIETGNEKYVLVEAADLIAKYVQTDAIPA
jgi:chaperonin GroES